MDMQATQDAALDSVLCEWHQWAGRDRVANGFHHSASGCTGYRSSRQHDFDNGAIDNEIDDARMKVVDFHVGELPPTSQAALRCQARALTVGCAVFTSPRLPADPVERRAVVTVARSMLLRRLVASGVL